MPLGILLTIVAPFAIVAALLLALYLVLVELVLRRLLGCADEIGVGYIFLLYYFLVERALNAGQAYVRSETV